MAAFVPVLATGGAGADVAKASELHRSHAIALYGEPKYGPDFTHFDYVNPHARKGGGVTLGAVGRFGSLNPFISRGRSAAGIQLLFESLTIRSADEEHTRYGLLAESIEWPDDRSWVAFTLHPEARWHDRVPVTVDDVVWSLNTLRSEGHPALRKYYAGILRAEKAGERKVKFIFEESGNRELPLVAGQLPVLPRHHWLRRDFKAAAILDVPIGSGPYQIRRIGLDGRWIEYRYDSGYWGRNLPVNQGRNNVRTIRYDYFRDRAAVREALKAKKVDLFYENVAKAWSTAYEVPARKLGMLKKQEIERPAPPPMQGFVFNTRRPVFKSRGVRAALSHVFDFKWTNRKLFHGAYRRNQSFVTHAGLYGFGDAVDVDVAKVFQSLTRMGGVPPEAGKYRYKPPDTVDLAKAGALLAGAGWHVNAKAGSLTDKSGKAMNFEIMLPAHGMKRLVEPFIRNLAPLKAKAHVNVIDSPHEYLERLATHDFDMVVGTMGMSALPTAGELRAFWSRDTAELYGTLNLAGVMNPAVDELIAKMVVAKDRKTWIAYMKALDQVLLWNHYVVPMGHSPVNRFVHWDKFRFPEKMPSGGELLLHHLWVDPGMAQALQSKWLRLQRQR